MTRQRSSSPLVLIFGEDDNDRRVIQYLLVGLRPDLSTGCIRKLKDPPTLIKGLELAKRRSRSTKVLATIRALHVSTGVRATFLHEDADAIEPAHKATIELIEAAYRAAPGAIFPVVPAWEMEAWWFLFPSAVAAVHRNWKSPNEFVGQNVGKIRNAKERLRKSVRPVGLSPRANFRGYEASDSPQVARNVVLLNLLQNPAGQSASWEHFVSSAASC